MSKLFRRHTSLQCFFCNSLIPSPQNPQNFRCPTCACWNRYDINGEIISDEPAMHDESMNTRSFAKRASATKDRFPSAYSRGPFCHNCQTNQMLIVNLMSNYLPPPNSPEYARRLELLPSYKESLESRYPPVCDACLPAVEEEIHKKDQMARVQALGGWLKDSKGKDQKRRVSTSRGGKGSSSLRTLGWRLRGCLWSLGYIISFVGSGSAAFGHAPLPSLTPWMSALPMLVLVSILWTAWDPTYVSYHRARAQGRDVRQRGKGKYVVLQLAVWIYRLSTSILLVWSPWNFFPINNVSIPHTRKYYAFGCILEFTVFAASWMVLQLQHPPTIRLIDTNSHSLGPSRASTPRPHTPLRASPSMTHHSSSATHLLSPDALAALTLSSKPIFVKPKVSQTPMFGVSSFPKSSSPLSNHDRIRHRSGEPDEMDWTPTSGSGDVNMMDEDEMTDVDSGSGNANKDTTSWLRPQRFFAPEKPTGLETLLERTSLTDENEFVRPDPNKISSLRDFMRSHSISLVCGVIPLLMGVVYALWLKFRALPVITTSSL